MYGKTHVSYIVHIKKHSENSGRCIRLVKIWSLV
jgi:hypothetical protein